MRGVREPFGLADDPARKRWKKLLEFLTDRQYPGGKTREVPRITFQATAIGWTATLTDYTLSMAYKVEFRYLADLFAALSTGFTDMNAKWVPVKVGDGYKARKEAERQALASRPDKVYDAVKGGREDPK